MCTVTAHSDADSLIVTMNRDERIERYEAEWRMNSQSAATYAYPVDGVANGSWFGVHSSGFVLCLLNRYQDHLKTGKVSRGQIILQALALGQHSQITTWLDTKFTPQDYNPFRLLIFHQQCIDVYDWNNITLTHQKILNQPWFIATSSSQDAANIIPYRKELFANWLKNEPKKTNIMDFHLKQHPHDKSQSVLMSRSYSHTKSITQCVVSNQNKRMDISYLDELALCDLTNRTQREALDLSIQFSLKLTN